MMTAFGTIEMAVEAMKKQAMITSPSLLKMKN